MFFSFRHNYACDRRIDGQTDGQNYDPEDCASIAASHGKNFGKNNKNFDNIM